MDAGDCIHSHEPHADGRLVLDETYEPQHLNHTAQPDPEAVKFQKIVFLGTGSAIPSPGRRNTSAIGIVLNNASSILLDCGQSTHGEMR
jgi:hypothetical protein